MRPAKTEATDYWFGYIDQVSDGEIIPLLRAQHDSALAQLSAICEAGSAYRYAAGKWSIRQLLGHISDCERLFTFRAFWFARGFDSDLPSFDDTIAAAAAESDRLPWEQHLMEFRTVREATLSFLVGLSSSAWDRSGLASGSRFTVRALAWIAAGHTAHHLKVLAARY